MVLTGTAGSEIIGPRLLSAGRPIWIFLGGHMGNRFGIDVGGVAAEAAFGDVMVERLGRRVS